MMSSERIIIALVWALLLPGLFFSLRKALRRRKNRCKGAEKD